MNMHRVVDFAVAVCELGIEFDKTIVIEDLSFSLRGGEITVVVGPSGAGKSTLLQVIAGILAPARGSIQINSRVRTDEPRTRRDIGFVFQDSLLFPWRNIRRNVEFGLEGLGLGRAERRRRAEAALALVSLGDHVWKWPHQLSGGQRQRVGLARALAVEPTLLLMDEPFAALDPKNRRLLQNELLDIVERQEVSVLFVTHDMHEAVYLADRVLVLSASPARLVADIRVNDPRPRSRSQQNPLIDHLHRTFDLHTNEEDI